MTKSFPQQFSAPATVEQRTRHGLLKQLTGRLLKKWHEKKMRCEYMADYLGVRNKNLDFLVDPDFARAWALSRQVAEKGWDRVPDIRWRAHIAAWAARHALNLEGDFVECGVYTGLLSLTICHYLKFDTVDKNFYLFDLWEHVPLDTVGQEERGLMRHHNASLYSKFDVYDSTRQAFSAFPNCRLVRGFLPDTLVHAPEKISYLSVDLNNTPAEKACIEALWPRLTRGAVVVVDDYAWKGHEQQRDMWDAFARAQGTSVACLPTAQGILIKP